MNSDTTFDYVDVAYLARNLNEAQLRYEIYKAEISSVVTDQFRGTEFEIPEDSFDFQGWLWACKQALSDQRETRPKPAPSPGRVNIEAIKAKNDIVAVIEGYTKLRKSGKNFTGKCPIHQDKTPSLHVYPDQQTFHCYGCQQGGDVISFIQAVEHTDFRGAAAILGGR